jgi:hypothetical protein
MVSSSEGAQLSEPQIADILGHAAKGGKLIYKKAA